jgi:pilus assembly protein Flp/PilA
MAPYGLLTFPKGGEIDMTTLLASVLGRLHSDDDGQGLAEYALILALIAVLAIIALLFLGSQISDRSAKSGTPSRRSSYRRSRRQNGLIEGPAGLRSGGSLHVRQPCTGPCSTRAFLQLLTRGS